MRSLILAAIIWLTSNSAFACMYDTQCEQSGGDDDVPVKRSPSKGKTCGYDDDRDPGARCIKGSGREGVCIGN
jgi:hypothetical protein